MIANNLKPGMAVNIEGQLYVITRCEHVKPGKGPAYIQTKLKSIASGSIIEKRLRSSEDVDYVTLDRRQMEYLYTDATGHVFMDGETFDQITVDPELLGDSMKFIKPNESISVQMYQGRIVSIELPAAVDLVVTETTPQVKGATATNQLKEATLETGLKTRVPPFIEMGEKVRISTDDASYLGRVND